MPSPTDTGTPADSPSLRERFAALRNLPPFLRQIWAASATLTLLTLVLRLLRAFVPVALVSAGLRGVLEAHQEFRRINQIKIAVGTANYLSPLVVLPFTDSLTPVVAAITDTASLAFNSNISAADAAEKLRKAIAEASR